MAIRLTTCLRLRPILLLAIASSILIALATRRPTFLYLDNPNFHLSVRAQSRYAQPQCGMCQANASLCEMLG